MANKVVDIYYNGVRIPCSTSRCPTPFLEVSVEPIRYGKFWKKKENLTLSGQLILDICGQSNQQKWDKITTFRNLFKDDFKILEVRENNNVILSRKNVKVASVSVSDSRLIGAVDYSVNLECYPLDDGESVLDPQMTVSISESEDGSISISSNCSARGVLDDGSSSDALENAITYVTDKIEDCLGLIPSSTNVVGFGATKAILISEQEQINRFESSYSLSREYVMNARGSSPFLFQSSTDVSYDEIDGIYNVSLNGSISGGIDKSMSDVRAEFSKIKAFSLCSTALKNAIQPGPGGTLNPNPVSQSIDESEEEKLINFSFAYTSDSEAGNVVFEYDTTVEFNSEESTWSVSLSGEIFGKRGQLINYNDVRAFYNSVNVRAICLSALSKEVAGVVINETPESFEVSSDEISGNISISASYAQKKNQANIAGLDKIDYNLDVQRPINEWKPFQTMWDKTKIFDIESMKRGEVSLSGTARAKDICSSTDFSAQIASWIKGEAAKYTGGGTNQFIESISVTRSSEGNSYDFSITLSFSGGSFSYNH
jgi:hypothetical protein